MSDSKDLRLRILFTINSSPQYILARSHLPVPVVLIPASHHTPPSAESGTSTSSVACPSYGTVSLKKCLDTICQSSPELVQDTTRDYSVYVLDPLESNAAPAQVHISYSNLTTSSAPSQDGVGAQPRGVAVGLGLMSWALQAKEIDSIPVVGSVTKQATGLEALEVIFALRETVAMDKALLPVTVKSWSQPSRAPSAGSSSKNNSQLVPESMSHTSTAAAAKLSSSSSSASTSPSSVSSTMNTLATLASIHLRTKTKTKPKKIPKASTIPVTESDKLMSAPETYYIGPVKKKGRPKGSIEYRPPVTRENINAVASGSGIKCCDEEVIVVEDRHSDVGGLSSKTRHSETAPKQKPKKRRSQHNILTPPFSTAPLIRGHPDPDPPPPSVPSVDNPEPTLLDLLAIITATSPPSGSTQNATLLSVLNAIDAGGPSSSNSKPNPALIAAIKQLLSVCSTSNTDPSACPITPQQSTAQDDEVIVLDKENVNPTAFRRRAEREYQEAKLNGSSSAHPVDLDAPFKESQERVSYGRGLSNKLDENSPPKHATATSSSRASEGIRRKRTLSDFMEERDSGRSRGTSNDRERAERRDGHRHRQISSYENSSRHYAKVLHFNQQRPGPTGNSYYPTGIEPWTSPPRPSTSVNARMTESSADHGKRRDGMDSDNAPKVAASSPVRSSIAQAQGRRKYIVPEWARTSTATQPRLSEEAQRALDEAEEGKRKERAAGRRKAATISQEKGKQKAMNPVAIVTSTTQETNAHSTISRASAMIVPGPIAAQSDGPIISVSDSMPRFSPSKLSTPPSNSMPLPQTPVRERRSNRFTPGAESTSLFTPGLFTPVVNSGSVESRNAYSPLFSPFDSGVLTSPLGNRKKAKMSPIQSVVSGRGVVETNGWGFGKELVTTNTQEEEEGIDEDLVQELDSAFEDLECPPSSLPIASSDIDVDEAIARTSGDQSGSQDSDCDAQTKDHDTTVKLQWADLPPSSPPPPTSPLLIPETEGDFRTDDEDMEDLELPVATSDAGMEDFLEEGDILSPNDEASACSEEELMAFDRDLAALFSGSRNDDRKLSGSEMDIFEQFTNVNAQSSDGPDMNMDPSIDSLFQNGLQDIDFTEFWETFKPLVEDHAIGGIGSSGAQTEGLDFGLGNADTSMGTLELDHTKLAEDVRALFSGCLM
ncbi:hypothetical protein BDQ12DRAFT_730508 [Crucibulum laeve]|uniref:Ams2/SPT21 N-terminal domain-containing protein n=1 Tax=Crucibulum laeve TaxID=68775 RepID=A0A5C3MHP6_9AGAR|nr:hypothetical protein BDQ12DRAFT_730508 [Crucibulum laeve]